LVALNGGQPDRLGFDRVDILQHVGVTAYGHNWRLDADVCDEVAARRLKLGDAGHDRHLAEVRLLKDGYSHLHRTGLDGDALDDLALAVEREQCQFVVNRLAHVRNIHRYANLADQLHRRGRAAERRHGRLDGHHARPVANRQLAVLHKLDGQLANGQLLNLDDHRRRAHREQHRLHAVRHPGLKLDGVLAAGQPGQVRHDDEVVAGQLAHRVAGRMHTDGRGFRGLIGDDVTVIRPDILHGDWLVEVQVDRRV